MDTPITRAEFNATREADGAQVQRLDEKDNRQDQRIDNLEKQAERFGELYTTVMQEKAENARQNKRIEAVEKHYEQIVAITKSMAEMQIDIKNIFVTLKQQGDYIEAEKARDGEKWRKAIWYVLTTILGLIVGMLFKNTVSAEGIVTAAPAETAYFLSSYVVLPVVCTCLCVGYIIKNLVPSDKINRFIPLIMGLLGIIINLCLHEMTFSVDAILGGLTSGLASTGGYELVRNLIDKYKGEK